MATTSATEPSAANAADPITSPDPAAGGPADGGSATVGIVGAGYVGLTTAVCLAHLGHQVVCADIDEQRVERLRAGEVPIVEAGMAELLADGLASGRLRFEVGAEAAAADAEFVFLCVPTPQSADGGADLRYVETAAAQIAAVLRPGAIVVNKSTVPVGSARLVDDVIQRDDVAIVSNPEFLREGTSINDFLHPDRVVIGATDPADGERLAKLYASLGAPVLVTDPASAETIKYAANGFLAMKISFINAVAAMCEAVGANIDDVVRGIGADRRIGEQFLRPGPGWGGSCFPKDSRALVKIAADHGYDFTLMKGVIDVNQEQTRRMVAKVRDAAGVSSGMSLRGVRVALLGLTFKAGTDDLRDSPAIAIAQSLVSAQATVVAVDPTVTAERAAAQPALAGIEIAADVIAASIGAAVVVIATEWPEFATLDLQALAEVAPGAAIVDTRNLLDGAAVRGAGLGYQGVGRS